MESLPDRLALPSFGIVQQKLQAYVDAFDGRVKPYEEIEGAFEALFHDDFVHTLDDRSIDKHRMRGITKILLSFGTRAEISLCNPLDEVTFEVKLHLVSRVSEIHTYSRGTIGIDRLMGLEAHEDAPRWRALESLLEAKDNFEYFVEIQADVGVTLDGIGDAFDRLFGDEDVAAINRERMSDRGMRTTSRFDDVALADFALIRCEAMDEGRLEAVVRGNFYDSPRDEVWQDVLTVRDGAIVMIEPSTPGRLAPDGRALDEVRKLPAIEDRKMPAIEDRKMPQIEDRKMPAIEDRKMPAIRVSATTVPQLRRILGGASFRRIVHTIP